MTKPTRRRVLRIAIEDLIALREEMIERGQDPAAIQGEIERLAGRLANSPEE